MNEPTHTPEPIVIPAEQIEVLPAGPLSDIAPPVKEAAFETVEIEPKEIPPGIRKQFYYALRDGSALLRGVEFTPGAILVKVMAGIDEYELPEGKKWAEQYPNPIEIQAGPSGVFITAILKNPSAVPMRASVAYLLEKRAADPNVRHESPAELAATSRPTSSAGVRRGPPRGPTPGGVPGVNRRVGAPSRNGDRPQPSRAVNPRIAQPGGPGPRRVALPGEHASLSPTIAPRRRSVADPDVRTSGEPETRPGEVLVRIERWRWSALGDLARMGTPIPPDHVGAMQSALRRGGDSPGEPLVLPEKLAESLLRLLERGVRLETYEREELGRRLDIARAGYVPEVTREAETAPVLPDVEPAVAPGVPA
jgi:hypothetical protein